MHFKLYRFNPRRAMRGVEAAQFIVKNDDGSEDLLWMSQKDIRANIRDFGNSPELQKGLEHYRTKKEFEGALN